MAMESDIRRQKEEYRDLKEKIKDLEKEKDKLRNSQKIGWFFFWCEGFVINVNFIKRSNKF